ncbi:Glycosyl hydrolase family 67 N-terminus [Chryseobacterium taeanense]|uniref:Glycosyl hydrolase family 67 N-terminus n=1 Tax=Chryseobacterium taeanense TaxID=311334 RepID=A0A1G8FB13_9FLAO|nr:Glycosyl hydrolase family 67 N-terminus [Chryseobacterium taeanense]
MKNYFILLLSLFSFNLFAIDHNNIVSNELKPGNFPLIENGVPGKILIDENDDSAVKIAVANLQKDFERVSGRQAEMMFTSQGNRLIIIGSLGSRYIKMLIKNGKINEKELKNKNEKYIMTVVSNPLPGVHEALVIVGSDRRGTVYGTYELSEQIGVSPWYDWADVPVIKHQNLSIKPGKYTAGEPAVKYRGIFLNDEAPCLTTWVYNTYGTKYGDHRFMPEFLSFCSVYVPTTFGLQCGAGVSMRMMIKTAKPQTKWALLWGHPTTSLWREIIRNG